MSDLVEYKPGTAFPGVISRTTHQPQPSGLRIDERMIQGDRPIIEYRRRRDALKERDRT